MKKMVSVCFMLSFMMLLCIGSSAYAGQWRFPVGISYISGFHNIVDVFKDNLRAQGYTVSDSYVVPVGLTFQPYYQFDSGIGIGGGFGPFMYLRAESSSTSYSLYNLPVNLCLRYALLPSSDISPYIRAGASYNFAYGDYAGMRDVGFLGGVGVEFLRKRKVGFGLELAYDSSEIEIERIGKSNKRVKPNEIVVSLFAVF
jgi:hypothetical protein